MVPRTNAQKAIDFGIAYGMSSPGQTFAPAFSFDSVIVDEWITVTDLGPVTGRFDSSDPHESNPPREDFVHDSLTQLQVHTIEHKPMNRHERRAAAAKKRK